MRVYKVNQYFGKRVQKIRQKKKISQEELGAMVGVHRNHMGRIERGETNPPLPLVEKIARSLKAQSSDLLPF